MHHPFQMFMAAIMTTLLLALGTGAAAASRNLVTSAQSLTLTVRGLVFSSGFANTTCDVTLRGSLHRVIAKTNGTLAGYVTEGRAVNCSNNQGLASAATPLVSASEPWHKTYDSFAGALPAITGLVMTLNGLRLLIRVGTVSCLYSVTVDMEVRGTGGPREFTTEAVEFRANTANLVSATGEEFFRRCSATGSLGRQNWTMTRIRVTLI